MNIWSVLGIQKTKDKDLIVKAYRQKLTTVNPEDDAEGFMQLRQAYEEAVDFCNKEEKEENTPIGMWIKKVGNLYADFYRRIVADNWTEVLEDEICVNLDSKLQARQELLAYFMDYYRLPKAVWVKINEAMDIVLSREELCEKFPTDYIDYVIDQITNYEGFKYEYFEGSPEEDYDAYITKLGDLKRLIAEKKVEESERLYNELREINIYHPFLDVENIRLLITKSEFEEAMELASALDLKYPNEVSIIYIKAEAEWSASCFADAKASYTRLLEIKPDHYYSKTGIADCDLHLGNYEEAKKLYIELIKQNNYDTYIRNNIAVVNEKLIEIYKKRYENQDRSALLELTWCYFQNNQFDEAIKYLEKIEPTFEEQGKYYNQLGRCYINIDEEDKGLEYIKKGLEYVLSVKDAYQQELESEGVTEERKEELKKELDRESYFNYLIGRVYMNKKEYEKAIEYTDTAISIDKDVMFFEQKEEILFKQGKYEECVELCDNTLNLDDNSYSTYLNRAESLYALERYRDALEDCCSCFNIYPYYLRPYNMAIDIYQEVERWEDAENIINKALSIGIESDYIYIRKAKNERKQSNYDEAIEIIKKVEDRVNKGESDLDTLDTLWYEAGLIYSDIDKNDTAMMYTLKALEISPKEFRYLYLKAFILIDSDKFNEADKVCDELLKMGERDIVYYQKARIAEENDNTTLAIKLHKKVLKLNPEHPWSNGRLGELYDNIGELDKALSYLNRQLEIQESGYYFVARGIVYEQLDKWNEALADYDAALEINENNVYAYSNKGKTYMLMEREEQAVECFLKAIEVMHNFEDTPAPYLNLGRCYARMGEEEKAIKTYIEGIELFPRRRELYYRVVRLLINCQRYEEAIFYAEEALKVENNKDCWFNALIAEAYVRNGNSKKGIKQYLETRKEAVRSGEAYIFTKGGEIYCEIGEYKKALKEYIEAYNYEPDWTSAMHDLAVIYTKMGNSENAKPYIYKLIQQYESSDNTLNSSKALDLFYVADCYRMLGEYDRMKNIIHQLFATRRCDTCDYAECYEKYEVLAKYYNDIGEYQKALDTFDIIEGIVYNMDEYKNDIDEIKKKQKALEKNKN